MTKIRNKKMTKTKSNSKLKTLEFSNCMVVLNNIALDKDLVQRYKLSFPEKIKNLKSLPSCNNVSNNSNTWMLKKNVPEDNSINKTYTTRSRSRKLLAKNNQNCKNFQYLDNTLYRSNCRGITSAQKQHLKYNSRAKSCSSISNDDISSNFSNTCFTSVPEEIISIHNKKNNNNKVQRKNGHKRKLSFKSDTSSESFIHNDESYLDKKNISINKNKRKKLNENHLVEVPQTKNVIVCSCIEKNNHLHAESISNEKVSKTKMEQCQVHISKDNLSNNFFNSHNNINNLNKNKIATSTSDTSLTTCSTVQTMDYSESLLKSVSPTVFKTNHITQTVLNVLTCNEKQCTTNKKTTKKSLPKITGDYMLPKDAIKITRRITSDENLKNNFLNHNRNTNDNLKQVTCIDNTPKSTEILKKNECHTLETNSSINELQIPEFTPTLNNNIELENKHVDSDKLHTLKVDHEKDSLTEIRSDTSSNVNINDINSGTSKVNKNDILSEQKQLNKLDNDEMSKSNMLQDDICNKNSDKIENTSNLVDIKKNCNVNKSLVLVNQKNVKQDQKCTVKKNTIDITFNNKKTKLNRIIWLQNNVSETRSLNDQQCNEISDIGSMTINSTTVKKLNSTNQELDLRHRLNEKKSEKKIKKIIKPLTSENEFNNKNNAELKQIISCDKVSDEKSASSNSLLNGEKDSQPEEKDSDDHDCISLFAESFDSDFSEDTNKCQTNVSQTSKSEVVKPQMSEFQIDKPQISESQLNESEMTEFQINKSQIRESQVNQPQTSKSQINKSQSDRTLYPYTSYMSGSMFEKYVSQNAREFNNEYEKYTNNNIQIPNNVDETRKECNNKFIQTYTNTRNISQTKAVLNLTPYHVKRLVHGYCFYFLKKGRCNNVKCIYSQDLRHLVNKIILNDSETIFYIMQCLLDENYIFLFKTVYARSLQKLTKDIILKIYKKFYETKVTYYDKKQILPITIEQLLKMEMSLKTVVKFLVECITSSTDVDTYIDVVNILYCINSYVKEGEYWETIKNSVLHLAPNKYIIEKILVDCINDRNFTDLQDINNNLLNKVSSEFMSTLDKNLLNHFKSLLPEKTTNNSCFALGQNVGGTSYATIASPDGSTNLSQTEFPKINNNGTNTSENENNWATEINGEVYRVQAIEDLPESRSVFRDHEKFWKFYADLDRLQRGLSHEDYDYVIDILKFYAEKQDESLLFTRSCCKILQREISRSAHHLANIVSQAVQMDTFTILGKMLFYITLDCLTSLINMESWGLALKLIQSLAMYNLPCNAKYFLLSAEIYLANKQTLEAYELLKQKNIICTNSQKWHVESTSEDERVRNKVMQILMDSLCNNFIEYAFYLFQFLLTDQSSQYYPIDLSSYVNRLIIIFLSKKDSNSIVQMANLVLKYTFALSKTTGRALTSTLIHLDENLARQLYNYAEGIGIYSAMKLWPIISIIIKDDLTEEEIYLIFLQMLKNLVDNYGHAIEFARSHQMKIYVIFEITSTTHFYSVELQNYHNRKAINAIKKLVRQVLQKRFDPPIILMPGSKGRIYKLQSKSVINYLKTEHCH